MEKIPYNRIPGQLPIFLDTIDFFPKVSRFFNGDFRDPNSFRNVWQDVRSFPFARKEVSKILVREQERYGASDAAVDNAKLLADSATAAVLTGQQIGLIGGPLYTAIKALAAIQWAERLTDILNTPVVPIFWMEGEDHDFEEIRRVNVLDQDANLVSVELEDRRTDSHQVVGFHCPGSEMTEFLKHLDQVLPPGMHRDDILNQVRACYQSGISLSDGFGKWLSGWLGDRGLVVVESLNSELKRIAGAHFQRAVHRADQHAELFEQRVRDLNQAGYSCTLTPSTAFHFFYILDDGVRKPVPLDSSSPGMARDQLLKMAEEQPERFSPKAILRPVIQDVLFPTVAIVAGPGEVSYFPQVQPLYEDFERPMPVIIPRPGITLLEKSWIRNMEKLSLTVPDLFLPQNEINRKIAGQDHSKMIEDMGHRVHQINEILDELEYTVSSAVPDLSKSAQKLREEISSKLQRFIHRFQNDVVGADKDVVERIQLLQCAIFPSRKLQERVYSPLNFLIRHGFQWVAERIMSAPIDDYNHFIVPLEE